MRRSASSACDRVGRSRARRRPICIGPTGRVQAGRLHDVPGPLRGEPESCINGSVRDEPVPGVTCPARPVLRRRPVLRQLRRRRLPRRPALPPRRVRDRSVRQAVPVRPGLQRRRPASACTDPCQFVQCPQGQWCNPNHDGGTCEDDPCVGTTCPNAGEVCKRRHLLRPGRLQARCRHRGARDHRRWRRLQHAGGGAGAGVRAARGWRSRSVLVAGGGAEVRS